MRWTFAFSPGLQLPLWKLRIEAVLDKPELGGGSNELEKKEIFLTVNFSGLNLANEDALLGSIKKKPGKHL